MIAAVESSAAVRQDVQTEGRPGFVSAMARAWKRPSWTALEVAWRWSAGVPVVALCAWQALRLSHVVTVNVAALKAMTVFQPVAAANTMEATLHALAPVVGPVLLWLALLAFLLRTAAAAVGRTALERRFDAGFRPRRGVLFVFFALRTAALVLALALWLGGVGLANRFAITAPAARGAEPNVVLLFAFAVSGALVLFIAWCCAVWVLDAGTLAAAATGEGVMASLRAGIRSPKLRVGVIEINLVMGVVKLGLLVLLLVLSACPLPFETVESQAFLAWWWAGAVVLYLVTSDYFHVVRAAASAALFRTAQPTPHGKAAS